MIKDADYKLMPALCLDLDGTIRFSKSGEFINEPNDITLFSGIEDIIWSYKNQGFLICGITNQGSVACGHKIPADIEAEIQKTRQLFTKDPFDVIQSSFCMQEGNTEPYNHRSLLRKPDIGMLVLCEVQAFAQHIIIDWNNSLLVGDQETDKQCAQNANIQFCWAKDFFSL